MADIATGWIWFGFSVFLVIALCADTWLVNHSKRRSHQSMRAAISWTVFWVSCALVFNLLLWIYLNYQSGPHIANAKALEFLTGYVIEESLSIDNLFVFIMVFKQFHIPAAYQQRVFSYGIWGAVIMRLSVILIGIAMVQKFHWLLYVMGVFLLLTGMKLLLLQDEEKDLTESFVIRILKRFTRVTHELHGNQFFIKKNGLLYATPLFVALFFIEFSDLIFAFDSIPAIFAITTDPFIIWTSNIFAILGLRSLYFLLSGMLSTFRLLKYGIALILMFVGMKMVIEPWVHISTLVSLGVIASILLLFVVMSHACRQRE
jgi:tellurite resistance protein TerC